MFYSKICFVVKSASAADRSKYSAKNYEFWSWTQKEEWAVRLNKKTHQISIYSKRSCMYNFFHTKKKNKNKMSHSMTKPTKWCAPRKASDQPGHPPILISLCCPHEGSLATHWADCEDSDQPRLIRVFAGRTDNFVGFVIRQLEL